MTDRASLNEELTRLHNDTAHAKRLSELHEEAAGLMTNPAERRFQLTHAWVFAMVDGDDDRAGRLANELKRLGGL